MSFNYPDDCQGLDESLPWNDVSDVICEYCDHIMVPDAHNDQYAWKFTCPNCGHVDEGDNL